MSIYLRKEHSGLRGKALVNVIESTYPYLKDNNQYWSKRVRRDITSYCKCLRDESPYTIYACHYNDWHMPVVQIECVSKSNACTTNVEMINAFFDELPVFVGNLCTAHVKFDQNDWPNVCVSKDTKLYVSCMVGQLLPISMTEINNMCKNLNEVCTNFMTQLVCTRIKLVQTNCSKYDTPGLTLCVSNDKGKFGHASRLPAGIIAGLLSTESIVSPDIEYDNKDINMIHIPNYTDANKAKGLVNLISKQYKCEITIV